MMVFFVMVLVLLAGAVPVHGRTESEDTVFNMTQPHESMKNGTLSSSKLFPYYYLYFVMQWPRSSCNFVLTGCGQVPYGFTVHGLWPQYLPYDPPVLSGPNGGVDCTGSRFRRLNNRRLNRQVENLLNRYWPDLTAAVGHNRRFWEAQYDKHGSCTFNHPHDYFYQSLRLVGSLRNLNSTLFSPNRQGPRIEPGYVPYSPNHIRDAVKYVTGYRPRLSCVFPDNRVILWEIRFCAFRLQDGTVQLHDCNPHTDCRNRNVILPP